MKPNEEKIEAILQLKAQENTKELKSILGVIEYIAKFLLKLSEQTYRFKNYSNRMNHGSGTGLRNRLQADQPNANRRTLSEPLRKRQKTLTTDASKTGLASPYGRTR